jgi:hypothetical protein
MPEEEEWRPVDWIEGSKGYEVSSLGRVRRLPGNGTRAVPEAYGTERNDGYLSACVNYKIYRVHRLVARAFCPGYEPGLAVDHIDGDPSNNRADNLRWVTHDENNRRPKKTRQGGRPYGGLWWRNRLAAVIIEAVFGDLRDPDGGEDLTRHPGSCGS